MIKCGFCANGGEGCQECSDGGGFAPREREGDDGWRLGGDGRTSSH